MIYLEEHEVLILRPAKTGTNTIANAVRKMDVGAEIDTQLLHHPLDIIEERGFDLSKIDVVLVGRRPEDRAVSLSAWAAYKGDDDRFRDPSWAVLSGELFEFKLDPHGWWPFYAESVVRYLASKQLPRSIRFYRLEDQLHQLADFLHWRTLVRPEFGHDNKRPIEMKEEKLTEEARHALIDRWGPSTWDIFGYVKPPFTIPNRHV